MIFDKSRVYTALNANELKIGSKIIGASSLAGLQQKVVTMDVDKACEELTWIGGEHLMYRFQTADNEYLLVYLVEEQGLKWQDLKIGDLVCNGTTTSMVVAVDNYEAEGDNPQNSLHLCLGHLGWVRDEQLKDWELVKEEHNG